LLWQIHFHLDIVGFRRVFATMYLDDRLLTLHCIQLRPLSRQLAFLPESHCPRCKCLLSKFVENKRVFDKVLLNLVADPC
jgi:hypothetical protein